MLDLPVNVRPDELDPFIRRGQFLSGSFGLCLQRFQTDDAILRERLNCRQLRQPLFRIDQIVPVTPDTLQVFVPLLFRCKPQATLAHVAQSPVDLGQAFRLAAILRSVARDSLQFGVGTLNLARDFWNGLAAATRNENLPLLAFQRCQGSR